VKACNTALIGLTTAAVVASVLFDITASSAEEVSVTQPAAVTVAAPDDDPLFSLAEVNLENLLEILGLVAEDEESQEPQRNNEESEEDDEGGGFEASLSTGDEEEGTRARFSTNSRATRGGSDSDDDEPLISLFNVDAPFVDIPFIDWDESLFSLLDVETTRLA
jgi:hypothetical protein